MCEVFCVYIRLLMGMVHEMQAEAKGEGKMMGRQAVRLRAEDLTVRVQLGLGWPAT